MQCKLHPTVPAVNTCNQCGCWLCDDCTVGIQGRLFCRSCLTDLAAHHKDTSVHAAATVRPATKNISWGLLFFFSLFFPSGVNYMYLGFVKRGIAAMSGFFLIIYLVSVFSMWPLSTLFGLLLPAYFITCVFSGFHTRRRLIAGEVIDDNIDGIINFIRNNKHVIALVFIVLMGVSMMNRVPSLSFIVRRHGSFVSLLIIGLVVYALVRRHKSAGGDSDTTKPQ